MFDNLRTVVEMSENSAKEKVQAVCHDCNIESDIQADLVLVVSSGEFTDAFNELSTDYRRKNYYKQNLHFVEPVAMRYVKDDELIVDTFQYIPLIESLQALLSDSDMLAR